MSVCRQCRHAGRGKEPLERLCRRRRESVRAGAAGCEAFEMSARAMLEGVCGAERRIEEMALRAQRYREMARMATGSVEATRVSGTPGRSRVESNVNRLVDIAREIDAQAERLHARRAEAARMIEGVSDPLGREVIELRYFDRLNWERIAQRMHYSRRAVIEMHGRALAEIERQMYPQKR